jgi:hypothetical protein
VQIAARFDRLLYGQDGKPLASYNDFHGNPAVVRLFEEIIERLKASRREPTGRNCEAMHGSEAIMDIGIPVKRTTVVPTKYPVPPTKDPGVMPPERREPEKVPEKIPA